MPGPRAGCSSRANQDRLAEAELTRPRARKISELPQGPIPFNMQTSEKKRVLLYSNVRSEPRRTTRYRDRAQDHIVDELVD